MQNYDAYDYAHYAYDNMPIITRMPIIMPMIMHIIMPSMVVMMMMMLMMILDGDDDYDDPIGFLYDSYRIHTGFIKDSYIESYIDSYIDANEFIMMMMMVIL